MANAILGDGVLASGLVMALGRSVSRIATGPKVSGVSGADPVVSAHGLAAQGPDSITSRK